ncbi:MAG: RNA polymerase sigma factor [Bacteroidales bacterium]|jgi:RNA polymerase sigma-70 factor (ECF subfamily)|nr:RNA polymerase sigma factor [Bacteroidales bacterium]
MTENDYNDCVNEQSDRLFRFLTGLSADSPKAKDVMQDVFLRLWERKSEVEVSKARAWMFRTAYNRWIDLQRHNKFLVGGDESALQCQKTENAYSDLRQVLNEALRTLPDVQKSVVLLRDYEGYSYDEIGKILSLSEQKVKVYIFRARTALKAYIGKIENVI